MKYSVMCSGPFLLPQQDKDKPINIRFRHITKLLEHLLLDIDVLIKLSCSEYPSESLKMKLLF